MPPTVDPTLVSTLRGAGCVFAEEEAALLTEAATSQADLDRLVAARVSGLPLEHVLGWVEFLGRRFAIEPGVFVPRRRTELLVRRALAVLARDSTSTVVDLCCGSGVVGATIASEVSSAHVYGADIDPVAVRCARGNLLPLGGQVFQGDLYGALPRALRGKVDLVVANAPYVPTDRIGLMPPEARDHEPRTALDGGPDGLDILRRVVLEAPRWLSPGGFAIVEVSPLQAPELISVADGAEMTGELIRDDTIGGSVLSLRRHPTSSPG